MPPKALQLPKKDPNLFPKGDIPFVVRCKDWRPHLPTTEPQKYFYDTNECSQLSGVNSVETQLNFLKPTMSTEVIAWFNANGYIDTNGSFAISERYTAIKSGTSIDGNSQESFWNAIKAYGILPRWKLPYSMEQSMKFQTQEAMCADYYDPKSITPDMEMFAKQSKQYFDCVYEYIWYDLSKTCPRALMETEMQHAPLHIGTPACPTWNTGTVTNCGEMDVAHATMSPYIESSLITDIRDQYNPYDKTLSADYFIPIVIKGVITLSSGTVNEPYVTLSVLLQFIQFLKDFGLWTAKGLRGIINIQQPAAHAM